MTICNTSIKLWGKNSVTRSIIAPKKNLIFSPTQIAKFSFMFYLLGVEHDGKKFGIVTISLNCSCMSQWARFGTSKIFIVPIV